MKLFHEYNKHHKMNLRHREKYIIKPENTVRLQRSAIQTMT